MMEYKLIPMSDIDPKAREIAVKWVEEHCPGFAIQEKHKLASDFMNYAREYMELNFDNEMEKRLSKDMTPEREAALIKEFEMYGKFKKSLKNENSEIIVK